MVQNWTGLSENLIALFFLISISFFNAIMYFLVDT